MSQSNVEPFPNSLECIECVRAAYGHSSTNAEVNIPVGPAEVEFCAIRNWVCVGVEIENSKTLARDERQCDCPCTCVIATFFSLHFHYRKEQVQPEFKKCYYCSSFVF